MCRCSNPTICRRDHGRSGQSKSRQTVITNGQKRVTPFNGKSGRAIAMFRIVRLVQSRAVMKTRKCADECAVRSVFLRKEQPIFFDTPPVVWTVKAVMQTKACKTGGPKQWIGVAGHDSTLLICHRNCDHIIRRCGAFLELLRQMSRIVRCPLRHAAGSPSEWPGASLARH